MDIHTEYNCNSSVCYSGRTASRVEELLAKMEESILNDHQQLCVEELPMANVVTNSTTTTISSCSSSSSTTCKNMKYVVLTSFNPEWQVHSEEEDKNNSTNNDISENQMGKLLAHQDDQRKGEAEVVEERETPKIETNLQKHAKEERLSDLRELQKLFKEQCLMISKFRSLQQQKQQKQHQQHHRQQVSTTTIQSMDDTINSPKTTTATTTTTLSTSTTSNIHTTPQKYTPSNNEPSPKSIVDFQHDYIVDNHDYDYDDGNSNGNGRGIDVVYRINGDERNKIDDGGNDGTDALHFTFDGRSNSLDNDNGKSNDDGSALSFQLDDLDGSTGSEFQFDDNIDGTDSEIQAAVAEIQQLASRTNLIIAINQIQSLQHENDTLCKEVVTKNNRIKELQTSLTSLQEQVASLSLERDLYKADACKTKEDIQTCVSKMFDLPSMVNHNDDIVEEKENDAKEVEREEGKISLPVAGTGAEDSPISSSLKKKEEEKKRSLPPTVAAKQTTITASTLPGMFPKSKIKIVGFETTCAYNDQSCSDMTKNREEKLLLRPILSVSKSDAQEEDSIYDNNNKNSCCKQEDKNLSLVFRRTTPLSTSASSRNDDDDERPLLLSAVPIEQEYYEKGMGIHKICCLFGKKRRPQQYQRHHYLRRRQSLPSFSSSSYSGTYHQHYRHYHEYTDNDVEILALRRREISRLQGLMKSSMDTSDNLRKRIMIISRYYESVIGKLQEKSSRLKVEKERMEVSLTNRISTIDHEMRKTILNLKVALQQRDEEIATLKEYNENNANSSVDTVEV